MIPDTCNGPTYPALLLRSVRHYHDRVAFTDDSRETRYSEVGDLIGRAQAALLGQGLKAGDCVALLTGNSIAGWCVGIAAQALGMSSTALHPLGSCDDHLRHLARAEASCVVINPERFAARGAEIAAAADIPVLTFGRMDYGVDLAAAMEHAGNVTAVDRSVSTDIAMRNFTGGTTGTPKMVRFRQSSWAAQNCAVLSNYEMPADVRLLTAGPISHVAAMMLLPMMMRGGQCRLLPDFDPERVLDTFTSDRSNVSLLVPSMIYAMLDSPAMKRADLSSLELLLYGASAMSPARLREGLERFGPVFAQIYGQTECFPLTYMPRADHDPSLPERLSACGFPVHECDVTLRDAEGREVDRGEPGEICVRSSFMMTDYHNNPEATAEALAGGWLHTGDIAHQDEEGRLYIVDRKRDMIITGGFNVWPRVIEDCLAEHPGIATSAVIGVPDDKWGEAVTAFVVLRTGAAVSADEIAAFVKRAKGSTHAPKAVHIVDRLPLTAAGKIDKKPLREQAWAGMARRVG